MNSFGNSNEATFGGYQPLDEVKVQAIPSAVPLMQLPVHSQPHIKKELTLGDVIVKSDLANADAATQYTEIVRHFNQGREGFMTTSYVRGVEIKSNQYVLAQKNGIPELVPFQGLNIALPFFKWLNTYENLGTFNQTDAFFGSNGHYVVNVPWGHLGKITVGFQPLLLDYGPHVIHAPSVKFEGIVSRLESCIQHGITTILQVPSGKVAAVRIGAQHEFFESRSAPYIIREPLFQLLINKETKEEFFDATKNIIINGAKKRILPGLGEVAITNNGGHLEIIRPKDDKTPTIIDSSTHEFKYFLDMTVQTLEFPSKEDIEERKAQKAGQKLTNEELDELTYDVFQIPNGPRIGVKLDLAYKIVNPELAVKELRKEGKVDNLIKHLESVVTIDMGKVMQGSSVLDFLASAQTAIKHQDAASQDRFAPSAPFAHLSDDVRAALAVDFKKYGIELIRLNFALPKILDKNFAAKVSENSLRIAEIHTQQSTATIQYNLSKQQAEQAAKKLEIEQKQHNENVVSAAEAQIRAAERRAAARRIEVAAEVSAKKELADAEAYVVKADAEARREATDKQARLYKEYPQLLEVKLQEIRRDTLKDAKMFVGLRPEEMFRVFGAPISNPFGIFTSSKTALDKPVVSTREENIKSIQEIKH